MRLTVERRAGRERERVVVRVEKAYDVLRLVRAAVEAVDQLERHVGRPEGMLLVVGDRVDDVPAERRRERDVLRLESFRVAGTVIVLDDMFVGREIADADALFERVSKLISSA